AQPSGGRKLKNPSRIIALTDVENAEFLKDSTISTPPVAWSEAVFPETGPIGDFMRFGRGICESADVYLLGAILPITAALIGRRCFFQFGEQRVFPNLFVLLVGQAGDRKSSAIKLAERLVARPLLAPNRFLAETSSSEALFDEYDEDRGGSQDKILIVDD